MPSCVPLEGRSVQVCVCVCVCMCVCVFETKRERKRVSDGYLHPDELETVHLKQSEWAPDSASPSRTHTEERDRI